ncbi:MAG: glucose-6-phosphate isomerase, partial [Sulfurovum sp. 28-43-6]
MKNKLYFNANNTKEEQRAFEAIVKEQETVGYYALPNQDVSPILEYCNTISQDVTTIAVIGIGGSSLGAKAVY